MTEKRFYALCVVVMVLFCLGVRKAWADTWGNPFAWENSELNLKNNSIDWNNSPFNWNNTYLNPYAKNGMYDNDGNRLSFGYPTKKDNLSRRAYNK